MGQPRPFCYFRSFQQQNNVNSSGIRTWILIIGEHADHLTTTTAHTLKSLLKCQTPKCTVWLSIHYLFGRQWIDCKLGLTLRIFGQFFGSFELVIK